MVDTEKYFKQKLYGYGGHKKVPLI